MPPVDLLHLNAQNYMLIVGIVELVCVGLILFGHYRPGVLATWVLLIVIIGALFSQFHVGERLQDSFVIATIFIMGCVLTRLYVMGAFNDARIKIKV